MNKTNFQSKVAKRDYVLVVSYRENNEAVKCLIDINDIPRHVLEFTEFSDDVHFDDHYDITTYLKESYDDDDYKSTLWLYNLFRFLEEGLADETPDVKMPFCYCKSAKEQSRVRDRMKGVTITSVPSGSNFPSNMKPSRMILLLASPIPKLTNRLPDELLTDDED